jgi:hypothetical protein
VEELSNRTIRIRNFYYDGGGGGGPTSGFTGWDLRTAPHQPQHPAGLSGLGERDAQYPIPDEISDDMFHSVAVWCYDFDLNFGTARFLSPSPEMATGGEQIRR